MIPTLTIVAPGAPSTPSPRIVLLDDHFYPSTLFDGLAGEVSPGEGVIGTDQAGAPGFRVEDLDALSTLDSAQPRVIVFVMTDTDVKTLAPVVRCFQNTRFILHPDQDRSAIEALDHEGIPFEANRVGRALPEADVALLASDWVPPRREFVRRCRRANLPTLCLQEAVNVDFDGAPHRMRRAATVGLSGPQTLRYLQRQVMFLTGNPRFDGYAPLPASETPKALINCNFILGLGGEHGRAWLDQVILAVEDVGMPFAITKHPRDDTDLRGVPNVMPSGAYKIQDQIGDCSVLISRDSSLPFEALLLNRPVVYFDPFQEKERTLREETTGLIKKCTDVSGLSRALSELHHISGPSDRPKSEDAYTGLFTSSDGQSHRRVARAIAALASAPHLYLSDDHLPESGFRCWVDETIQLRMRPALRRVSVLRRAVRASKRIRISRP